MTNTHTIKGATMEYFVEIVEHKSEEVVKRMGPMPERKADMVDSGANRNLDHEHYYTRIVEGS